MSLTIRAAQNTDADLEVLNQFCHDLAAHDNHQATATVERLRHNLFTHQNFTRAFIAELAAKPIGMIITCESFSAYMGQRGFYVTGAYIAPDHRGQGYGKALFAHVAAYAEDHGANYLSWIVESDNDKAATLYKHWGASIVGEWGYVYIAPKKFLSAKD